MIPLSHSRRAFSLVEILVVIAIIGVLVALLLPAVSSVRGAAAKIQCANNLKQMGLAMHAYHDAYGRIPPSRINPGTTAWRAGPLKDFHGTGTYKIYNHTGFLLMLPYLEQDSLYRQFDFTAPSSTAHEHVYANFTSADLANGGVIPQCNLDVIGTYVQSYHCPADKFPVIDTDPYWRAQGSTVNRYSHARVNARRSNYLFNVYDELLDINCPNVCDMPMQFATSTHSQTYPGLYASFPRGMFMDNARFRLEDTLDGLSNTIAIGETRQDHWDRPAYKIIPHWGSGESHSVSGAMRLELRTPVWVGVLHINYPYGRSWEATIIPDACPGGPANPRYWKQQRFGFGSNHAQGANFVFGDGSVHFLKNTTSFPVFNALGTANGVEDLDLNW